MTQIDAHYLVKESGIAEIVDQAKCERRLSIAIKPELWDRLRPAVMLLSGKYFQAINSPWQAFMLEGVWLERAKS